MIMPFMYGFVYKRWTHEVDVMINKKRDMGKVHQLRIIGILEADSTQLSRFYLQKQPNSVATCMMNSGDFDPTKL